MNIDLNELAKKIHQNAKDKGFWDSFRNKGELFMLIVSECGEALEAHRKNKFADWIKYQKMYSQLDKTKFEFCIKDTFEDEVADTVIRILDYVGYRNDIKIKLDIYEAAGDFQLVDEPNIGEVLLDVTGWIFKAYQSDMSFSFVETEDELNRLEACINAALILLFNLSVCCEFQLLRHIDMKVQYNSMRERLHGKAY